MEEVDEARIFGRKNILNAQRFLDFLNA